MSTNLALASIKSTGSSATRTFGDRFADVINAKDYGCVGDGSTDDSTALAAALAAAISAGKTLFLPKGVYKYTPPLTINGNVSIIGAGVYENWSGGINVPLGTPPLTGAILNPASNGSDAIDITGTSLCVHLKDFGILFQTPFSGTGDGIHYVPAQNVQGLSGSRWDNIKVYGHDGNHYAFNLTNLIYCEFDNCFSYGGGGFKLYGSSTSGHYGNSLFNQPYVQTVCGGSANCYDVECDSGGSFLNLLTFIRPQGITNSVLGTSPAGNLPTSAQSVWFEDTNVKVIRKISPDFESNVGSGVTLNPVATNNDFDFGGMSGGNLTGGINVPGWGTNGVFYGPQTRTVNDLTSTGTVAVQGQFAFPGHTVSASNAVTYTDLATLYVGLPSAGTNVTVTTRDSIYALGQIKTASSITAAAGAFITGSTQINASGSANAQIGSASAAVGIGKAAASTSVMSVAAATTAKSSLNVASGVAPTSPVNGDIWFDGTNIKMQIGGATKTFTLT